MSSAPQGYFTPHVGGHDFNQQKFFTNQFMGRVCTAKLVKVMGCTSSGDVAEAGTVDVQPLVNQVDGGGTSQQHGTIYKLTYNRIQGGKNAVIIDPVAGDIGWMIVADRDTSAAIAAKGQANPGSARRFSPSDGHYVGFCLNSTPDNYVAFKGNDVTVFAKGDVTVNCNDAMVVDVQTGRVNIGTKGGPFYAVETAGGESSTVFASV